MPSPGVLGLFDGEGGLDNVRGRASVVSAALYFFVDGGIKLGVVARDGGARPTSSQDETDESGRFGVNGVGLAILLGVGGTDIRVSVGRQKSSENG